MNIKNEIKNLLFKIVPYESFLKIMYKHLFKKNLDLNNPKRLTEKLFWLKAYNGQYKHEIIKKCYDKYRVRDYIADKLGTDKYLPKLYGIYDDANMIDFKNLPSKYVLKITQGCGLNIVNSGSLNDKKEEIRNNLKEWLENTNNGKYSNDNLAEAYCYDGNSKIICEEYLGEPEILTEKMFFCINGKVELLYTNFEYLDEDGNFKKKWIRNVYDKDLNFIDVQMCVENDKYLKIVDNGNINEMVKIAEKLSEDFPFVRVDMYDINGRIVVGELTFIPHGGFLSIDPIEYDYVWGELLELPNVSIDFKAVKKKCLDSFK